MMSIGLSLLGSPFATALKDHDDSNFRIKIPTFSFGFIIQKTVRIEDTVYVF